MEVALQNLISRDKEAAKTLVVAVLSKTWPLSPKQIHAAILFEKGTKHISYQGVHKAILELRDADVILKEENGYLLNRKWLSQISQEISSVITAYDAKDFEIYGGNTGKISAVFRALSLLKHLLTSGYLKLSRDEFFLYGNRIGMIAMYQYLILFQAIRKSKEPNLLYSSAHKLGVHWFRRLREQGISKGSLEEEIEFGCDALSIAGWGGINIEFVDAKNKLVTVSMDHSPFAAEYLKIAGKSPQPVDDMVRGCLAGGFTIILDDPTLEGIETQCIACGDEKCVFEIKPRADFNPRNSSLRLQL